MKIGDYIKAEDWNSLGRRTQFALRDGLQFMGHRVKELWFPGTRIKQSVIVVLTSRGDLVVDYTTGRYNRVSKEELRSFIELTSFRVKNETE